MAILAKALPRPDRTGTMAVPRRRLAMFQNQASSVLSFPAFFVRREKPEHVSLRFFPAYEEQGPNTERVETDGGHTKNEEAP